jgi:hypothetical protein
VASNRRSGSGGTFGGGGGENDLGNEELSHWYLTTLSISYDGEKAVYYTKTATNRWTFNMPAGNVVISGAFSQTPVESNELAILDVSVSSNTPTLSSGQYNYTVDIPHIFPTVPDQKFSIIAIPEDPDAEVTITDSSGTAVDGENDLIEGENVYTIKVYREGLKPDTKIYSLTVNYEPDLTLSSVAVSSSENPDWAHTVSPTDGYSIILPYDSVTIATSPNDTNVTLNADKTGAGNSLVTNSGDGTYSWTLGYTGISTEVNSAVHITASKKIGAADYTKEYTLNITKIDDPNYPNTRWAEGGDVLIIKDLDNKYYEIHIFTADGALSVNTGETDGLTARALVVAGGGGGGGANYPSHGGGGGGMVENDAYHLTTGSYPVVVGSGGARGESGSEGYNGGDSEFGDADNDGILAYGGGGGGGSVGGSGKDGGSGGGGRYTAGNEKPGKGGTPYGFPGGTSQAGGNSAGGGGGAGGSGSGGEVAGANNTNGLYGGPGRENDITGKTKVYAAGGMSSPYNGGHVHTGKNGEGNTGNGGGGAWNSNGGYGGSGVVIIRLPARPNS